MQFEHAYDNLFYALLRFLYFAGLGNECMFLFRVYVCCKLLEVNNLNRCTATTRVLFTIQWCRTGLIWLHQYCQAYFIEA